MTISTISMRWSRLFFYLALLNLIVISLAIAGRMSLGWQTMVSFHVFFYGAQLGLLLGVIGMLFVVAGLIKRQSAYSRLGGLTIIMGVCPLLLSLLAVGASGFSAPMIHDITTDMENPPVFVAAQALRSPNENKLEYEGMELAAKQRQGYPDITPVMTDLAPDQAFTRSLEVAQSLNWTVTDMNREDGRIEAYQQTAVFGFIDDVVIRIHPATGGSRIDIRSVSRVGVGDLGANAARIKRFAQGFQDNHIKSK